MAKETFQTFVGTAGWSIHKDYALQFPAEGSHLERYAQVLSGVEINSSFYRPHQAKTYERWAQSVPDEFRFAVKVPKVITHEMRLLNVHEPLERFLDETGGLGSKLGPLLVQLPPSLEFDAATIDQFFTLIRERFADEVVCEPRHTSWFAPGVEKLLVDFQVARVAADPAMVDTASQPGGWDGLVYYRLHGSPRIYYSEYEPDYLDRLDQELDQSSKLRTTWCIFDNTAGFAATGNALTVLEALRG